MNNIEAPIRIVADDRENAGGVIEELRRFVEVSVDVQRLKIGDFLVEERFAVERKTLMDFAQSVIDGRLFAQATALAPYTYTRLVFAAALGPGLFGDVIAAATVAGALMIVGSNLVLYWHVARASRRAAR